VESRFDEEHNLWEVAFTNAQGAVHVINWERVSSPESRQLISKYKQIETNLEPPFVIETVAKVSAKDKNKEKDEDEEAVEGEEGAAPRVAKKFAPTIVERSTPRELFDYVIGEGRKEYTIQRYKGLGEMTSPQLWETTMDPERRTLLSVKLEDIAETETIFSTLMGEDVEARRKFIEENALDVKNLDI
jgi:DNA gyrase subunit B